MSDFLSHSKSVPTLSPKRPHFVPTAKTAAKPHEPLVLALVSPLSPRFGRNKGRGFVCTPPPRRKKTASVGGLLALVLASQAARWASSWITSAPTRSLSR